MTNSENHHHHLVSQLKERHKELSCIHGVLAILSDYTSDLDDVIMKVVETIPDGWQFTDECYAEVLFSEKSYTVKEEKVARYSQIKTLSKNNYYFGEIKIYYRSVPEGFEEHPFLEEEDSLLSTIAEMLSTYLVVRTYTETLEGAEKSAEPERRDWKIVIRMLQDTDFRLYLKIARKLINLLYQRGVEEVKHIYNAQSLTHSDFQSEDILDANTPLKKRDYLDMEEVSRKVFQIAESCLPNEEVLEYIHKWIQEDKLSFLITALEDKETSLAELQDAIARYQHLKISKESLSPYSQLNLKVMLIQRLFTSQLEFIRIAKNYIQIEDFYDVLQHTISPKNSHGKLGGKSTGLFFANNIIKSETDLEFQKKIKTPKSWYITSDVMQSFIHYNNLEEVIEQKYKDIEQVRSEYPNIVQMYNNSSFPHEIIKELSQALDSFADAPIIVRSSSLLEDSYGTSFSGKYKSLFLANQGSKKDRLTALMDAIAEVYASIVGPDPIEYRKEHGLTDYHEEMAIMIQEVVGSKAGKYFFPAFAGVAFSSNEFRWSPRIKRNDGLIRLVPGLGTRAVDRLSNDYPVLASPGQPGVRVNASPDEVLKYSPKNIDVINLESNTFESLPVSTVLMECQDDFPMLNRIFSVNEGGFIHQKAVFNINFEEDDLIVTFRSLMTDTDFMSRMKKILDVLADKMKTPVDIEFAVKDNDIYLLQCRPQCFSKDVEPAPIPQDIPHKDIIFTASKHISNGKIPEVTHVVYVDPAKYYQLETLEELKKVGRCIGKLNTLLPKKKFILIGPGRWGSKGDIKLGVDVSYSEISNTSALIEVAKEQGNFAPDLSFGTHFFQDLVESTIRYIPLYPDESKNIFRHQFFTQSKNMLSTILPSFSDIEECVQVIDVPAETNGDVLKIFMNADLEQAIAYIGKATDAKKISNKSLYEDEHNDNYWLWRMQMSEHLAKQIDTKKFGVINLYIIGSVKNATAGPGSDIDLIVHFRGNEIKKAQLLAWFDGWSKCLARINYLKTGYKTEGLLDVHLITDKDIAEKSSYAIKIGAVTDAAKPLPLRK